MKQNTLKRQTGVGLIELMVAMVLALLLAMGMIMIFLSGRASFMTQEQVGRLQENGRYAYHLMSTELQRAGYRRASWNPPAFGFAFTANTVDGAADSPDTIELQYESDRDCFSQYNTVTENLLQPDGVSMLTVPQYYHKLVRFSVVDGQLMYRCSYGRVNGALAIQIDTAAADGVENLQLQYGEDLTNDLSVNQWVNAGGWSNFASVVSVRIAMIVRTPEEFATDEDKETFDLYSTTVPAAGDKRIRRVYAGQVSVRNLTI